MEQRRGTQREANESFPLVIAHRGASGVAPENTLAAFERAILDGADMFELDVHLSRDGEVMVIHDDSLERRTNGRGKVADFSRAELQSLEAGSWFGAEFSGERIPALEEVLHLAGNRIRVNVEIKTGYLGRFTMDDLADRTLACVERQGRVGRVLFSSFFPPALARIRSQSGEAELALLFDKPWQDSEALIARQRYRTINCGRKTVTEGSILAARERGLRINVWTVNDEREMERLIRAKVDGIITDFPARLVALRQRLC